MVSICILSVWAKGDTATDGGDLIRLTTSEGDLLASDAEGFDMTPFARDGASLNFDSVLTAEGLLDDELLAFIGDELWRRLTPGTIADALTGRLSDTRFYLDLRSEALRGLPWELLRYRDVFVFTQHSCRFCLGHPRAHAVPFAGTPPALDHPLRLMVIIGNKVDDDNINADEELARIERRAHLKNCDLLLKVLLRPDPDVIEGALKTFQPHILHFVGHGNVDTNGDPVIEVWSQTANVNESWAPQRIQAVFSQSPPRLVVLNACRTAAFKNSVSLIDAFSKAGCIAVVAMMGDIRGDASVEFSQAFYEALCDGNTVDEAATRARMFVRDVASVSDSHAVPLLRSNWLLPRVVIHGDAADALKVFQSQSDTRQWVAEDFVDRWDQRWNAWRTITETSRLTVFCGGKDSGKSELLRAVAEIWARQDRCVINVGLSGAPTGDFHQLLMQITERAENSDGIDASELRSALNETEAPSRVAPKFHHALERCAGGKQVLLAIDGLSEWESTVVNTIILPELCVPYLKTRDSSLVRMIVALRDMPEIRNWGAIPNGWTAIELGEFSVHEWQRAVQHLAWYWRGRVTDQNRQTFEGVVKLVSEGQIRAAQYLELVRNTAQIGSAA